MKAIPLTSVPSHEEAELLDHLARGGQVEQILACQYLFAAFSLKKYPEEFDQSLGEQVISAQLERNRRWGAKLLFTARQEMEHLCMVQNMLAILNRHSYMWRPNYPIPAQNSLIELPNHLTRFSAHAVETFRYYEKPDSMNLPNPFGSDAESGASAAGQAHIDSLVAAFADRKPLFAPKKFQSIQALYLRVGELFDELFKHRVITARNPNRIVNEHFGFNIDLEALVQGQGQKYVDDIIAQILEEGEGVGGVPPLGSHFMAFQSILDEMKSLAKELPALDPALPVVNDPSLLGPEFHVGETTPITNPYTRKVAQFFNDVCQLQTRMLTGFFDNYNVNQTTGIHPPEVNAYFQTAFYPMMTMLVRPLGEIVCRLPADADYVPEAGKLPKRTAGPTFEYAVHQGPGHGLEKRKVVAEYKTGEEYQAELNRLAKVCQDLADSVPAGYAPLGGRSYKENFTYLAQNLTRMAINFIRYWKGEMVTVVPSDNFQNLDNTN